MIVTGEVQGLPFFLSSKRAILKITIQFNFNHGKVANLVTSIFHPGQMKHPGNEVENLCVL